MRRTHASSDADKEKVGPLRKRVCSMWNMERVRGHSGSTGGTRRQRTLVGTCSFPKATEEANAGRWAGSPHPGEGSLF